MAAFTVCWENCSIFIHAQRSRDQPYEAGLVYELAGTEQVFFASLKSGETGNPLLNCFRHQRSTEFAICCINSKDALVRRAPVLGYWMQDKVYWQHAKALAQSDPIR